MGAALQRLERLVCDLLARDPGLAAGCGRDLQAIDLLAQRLRGLAGCLAALSDPLDRGEAPRRSQLERTLPLEAQRLALLGAAAAPGPRAEPSVELF
jgi:hypothetical protein